MTCTKCDLLKESEDFAKDKRWCRSCVSVYNREYKQRNNAKTLAYAREYRLKNLEKVKAATRQWQIDNPDMVKQHHKNYKRAHPDRIAYHNNLRRSRKRNAEGSFTLQEWKDLCQTHDNKCLSCGSSERLTIDHVVPLSIGGSNFIGNIQPLCGTCNNKKNGKTIDYRKRVGYEEQKE